MYRKVECVCIYNQELVRALGVMYTHVPEGISHKLRAHVFF